MEKVDRTHWERAELFEFFSAVSHPFYSVTFRVDVTNLYTMSRSGICRFITRWGIS